MTQAIKEEVETILRSGERDRAIRYLRDSFSISSQEAIVLVEALERESGMWAEAHPPLSQPLNTTADVFARTEERLPLPEAKRKTTAMIRTK